MIVRKGDPITPLELEKIQAFGLTDARVDLAKLAGWALLASLIVGLVLAWIWRFRPTVWHRTNVLLLIGLLLVFTTLALKLTAGRSVLPFFVPTAAAGILIAILLDASAAVILTAVIAVIGGAVNGNSLEITAYIFLGGLAGIVAVRRGDRLNAFVQAAIAIFVVNALVVTTFSLLGERDITGVVQLFGAGRRGRRLGRRGGRLLRRPRQPVRDPDGRSSCSSSRTRRSRSCAGCSIETPGTYHHSMMVGNLAERAAESIGADPLITRVAAYYHDVGKLANPTAFIENQAGGDNVHDDLEPERLRAILKQHVADGIDVAYRAQLPKSLIAFIPQHHGTALMSYFYAKAREEAAAPYGGPGTEEGKRAADAVDQRRYRHVGPKPQSREAALLMLADGVEASVRSLSSRDEPAIRSMVARIIQERLEDGQFDECDLTLRDISRIRRGLRRATPGDVPPAHRLPAEQDRRARIAPAAAAGGGSRQRRPAPVSPAPIAGGVEAMAPSPSPRALDLRRPLAGRPDYPARRSQARAHGRPCPNDRDRARRGGRPAAGLDRPDPDRRRGAGRAERHAHGQDRPDRRPVVPASAAAAFPLPPREGPRRAPDEAAATGGRGDGPATVDFVLPPGRRLHLGDIVVSVERAIEQAEAGRGGQTGDVRWSPADELRLLVTHGTLHVCGWDHAEPAEETSMRALEQGLRP